jgi:hypothetical protein
MNKIETGLPIDYREESVNWHEIMDKIIRYSEYLEKLMALKKLADEVKAVVEVKNGMP